MSPSHYLSGDPHFVLCSNDFSVVMGLDGWGARGMTYDRIGRVGETHMYLISITKNSRP